ncbi:MAG: hypothetical protein QOF19_1202 [Alphaproteobacteria bacterium]|jgi:hypothetical protein|nr:hypothetical protein [Alphaproteobacteria bacterium]
MASSASKKVTPNDVSELEREQLRFLLSGNDMAQVLVELNPSLSWLPTLYEMNLLKDDAALTVWVEQNFDSTEAVREVVANIRFFREESADLLEIRLDKKRNELPAFLVKCWQLIIRHIRNTRHDFPYREWFEILPRLKKGEHSTELLERLVTAVTPRLRVEKRFGWHDGEIEREIKEPSDLLTIRYEGDEGVNEQEFFSAWPDNASEATEQRLVRMLTHALVNILSDAVDVGIEHDRGLSLSDVDVPSVAAHEQNAFKHGLLTIVRITVELWARLAKKNSQLAASIFREWKSTPFRLVRRMALFAAADPHIPESEAANLLLVLPQGELFLTHSSVEVHRLIRQRWREFTDDERSRIEARVIEGPPSDWFREGADLERAMDRYRLELLSDFERSEIPLTKSATQLLGDIRQRHPKWQSVEPERNGFLMWHSGVRPVGGDTKKLENISAEQLVAAALKAKSEEDFLDGDSWQAFSQNDPAKAFEGIERAQPENKWIQNVWRPFLWSANKIADIPTLNRIAKRLAEWPNAAPFDEVSVGAAWWLDEVSDKLDDEALWPVWELVFTRAPRRTEVLNDDPFGTALNDAAGHLASILLKKIPEGSKELSPHLLARYDRLVGEHGNFGLLARVRFAAAIAFLFERAPDWSTKHIIPKFYWNSTEAGAMWSARKYSNHIGSSKLFELTKQPFLEMFARNDVGEEDIRVFSDWLGLILIVNRLGKADYPLIPSEVRTALRQAGHSSLSSFAHRLAIEMESVKTSEKVQMWTDIIGPIFKSAWPLDLELQSSKETFKLVQLLRATGDAFPQAVEVILPFVRAEDPRGHTSIYSLSEAGLSFYALAPEKMLELLSAIVGDAPPQSIYSLRTVLDKLSKANPKLVQTKRFQKLESQASGHG